MSLSACGTVSGGFLPLLRISSSGGGGLWELG